MVKFLTYNLFMRPPGSMYRHYTFITMTVSKPSGDYKSKRLKILGDSLSGFDIVCFQELFTAWSDRPTKLVEAVKKDGFKYFVHAPSPPVTSMRVVDAGLTVLSKHPIASTDFVLYKSANSSDMLAGKGILYMSVLINGTIPIHLFNTHMQASYNDTRPQSRATRAKQFKQMRKFILKHAADGLPVMVLGDFNVNAREDLKEEGLRDGKEYQTLIKALSGEEYNDEGLHFEVHDLLREQHGYHPVTYGDIIREDELSESSESDKPKKKQNTSTKAEARIARKEKYVANAKTNDTALTFPEEYCSQQRLDYVFYLNPKNSSGKVNVTIPPDTATVEPFYVKNEKFGQLSDHYGVSAPVFFQLVDDDNSPSTTSQS